MDKKKLSRFILGCDLEMIRETVIMAPCWLPDSVGISKVELIADGSCKIWDCKIEDDSFTYVLTGVGAWNCADTVMALKNTSCKRIMFIGSAGAIEKDICVGDIVLPDSFIVGEGASRYLQDDLKTDSFGDVLSISSINYEKIMSIAKESAEKYGVSCHAGRVISVESIYSQFHFISCFLEMGCRYLDMESSAFIASTKRSGLEGVVCFCISDNSTKDQSLVTVDSTLTRFRKSVRRNVMPVIIKKYISCKSVER